MRKPGASWSPIRRIAPITALAALATLGGCGGGDGNALGGGPSGFGLENPSSPKRTTSGTKTDNPGTTDAPTPKAPWTGTAPKGSVPVTGGTLLVTHDGVTAVAADPDRDTVSLVDLGTQSVSAQLTMPIGSEPGRVVEDGSGRVHVVLRRGGGIADIDVATRSLVGLRHVCALPRGIAYRSSDHALLVTCMTGALITMASDPAIKAPLSKEMLHTANGPLTDLRDILVSGDSAYVTTFRSAQVFKVTRDGAVVGKGVSLNIRVDPSAAELAANGLPGGTPQNYVPQVAWRAVLGPAGDVVVVHEGGTDRVINISKADNGGTQVPVSTSCTSSEYGGTVCTTTTGAPICAPPILIGLVSSISQSGAVSDGPALPQGALPVDIAPSADGRTYTIALAGNPSGSVGADGSKLNNILTVPAVNPSQSPSQNAQQFDGDLCGLTFSQNGQSVPGQVTAVANDGNGQVVAQTREPATLQYLTKSGTVAIALSRVSVADSGFDLFHTNTGQGMTCAGCHAEGQDDGRTWKFTDGFDSNGNPVAVQARRTQTFRAGFLETAPFHWNGEFSDVPALMQDVFIHRMGAATAPTPAQQTELQAWMNHIPPKMHDAPTASESKAIEHGKRIFEDSGVGCTSCHAGRNFTNNKSTDIGFGYTLQTPTLIDVAFRAPYLHDGSVATLADRFKDPTAMSGKHGATSQLTATEIKDLITYLESL